MDYQDEDILKEIFAEQKKEYIENEDKVEINGTTYEMERRTVSEKLFSAILPKHFSAMGEEIKEEKYPSKYRPQIVFTNEDTSLNFTFSYLDVPILKSDIENTIIGLKSTIKKVNPANTFYDISIQRNNTPPLAYFDYRSNALDHEVYNITFISIIKENLLLGSFSCIFKDKNDYKLLALRVINSIIETGVEDNE